MMQDWFFVALGIVGGIVTVAGVLYLAFRPYLAVEPPKAWMPEATGRATDSSISGANISGQQQSDIKRRADARFHWLTVWTTPRDRHILVTPIMGKSAL